MERDTEKSRNDRTTTVEDLRKLVSDFVDERDWQQFHSPKNLAMSIAIESAELMEHFQWCSVDESRQVTQQADKLTDVGEELADVVAYCLALANSLELDLSTILSRKMEKNRAKYPADEFRGRAE